MPVEVRHRQRADHNKQERVDSRQQRSGPKRMRQQSKQKLLKSVSVRESDSAKNNREDLREDVRSKRVCTEDQPRGETAANPG